MRVVLGAAAALVMLAGVAMAQTESPAPAQAPAVTATSQCGAIGAEPTIPDGAVATIEQINAANIAYQAWGESTRGVLECRRLEVQQTEATLRSLLDQHNAMALRLNTVTQTWQTESAEFCARRGNRCTPAEEGQPSQPR